MRYHTHDRHHGSTPGGPPTPGGQRLPGSQRPRARRSLARRSLAAVATLTASLLALAACAPADANSAGANAAGSAKQKITFALDWTPNTGHIGIYVADQLGYFDEAGLDVEVLPFGSTSATQLVAAGEADFGIGGQSDVQVGRAAGLDLLSVYRTTQVDIGSVVALGDRKDITRPADLDGLVFGGFSSPLYTAIAKGTIVGDGGKGDFTEVALDTGTYEALAQGRIDFTLSVSTWENLQAELEGRPYRAFTYQDFGVPDQQGGGIVTSSAFSKAKPKETAAFVQAVAKGYEYAADNPEKAAELLIKANPDTLGTAKELVLRSAQVMAEDGYLRSDERPIGAANPETWKAFGKFLLDRGLLVGPDGKVLKREPNWSEYYTDEFLK